jgi:hypothetical protein
MTAVPEAIDALIATLTRELRTARVIDGPAVNGGAGDTVWVGITPDDPTMDAPDDVAGLGKARGQFEIRCLARSWSGSADVATQRRKAYALVKGVKAALLADKTLGGAVMMARFAGSLYTPYFNEQNQLVVDVIFRVEVTAYS